MAQNKLIDTFTGIGSTSAGSSITLLSSTPPNSINSLVYLHVLATAAGEQRASWFRVGSVHKSAAGTITVDAEEDVYPRFSTDGIKKADIAVIINGGTIELQATGDVDFGTIDWQATAQVYRS